MTAIGKLLALLNLVAGLALLTWATSVYVQRPGWYDPPPDGVPDRGNSPLTFKMMQLEIEALSAGAQTASVRWGENLEALKTSEKLRADRKIAYAKRIEWARGGNPGDPIDPENPKTLNKGFYEAYASHKDALVKAQVDLRVAEKDVKDLEGRVPAADPKLKEARDRLKRIQAEIPLLTAELKDERVLGLHLLRPDPATLLPRGAAVLGIDGAPLPGVDVLLGSLEEDTKEINTLNADIVKIRGDVKKALTEKDVQDLDVLMNPKDYEVWGEGALINYKDVLRIRLGKMREIRDSVLAEKFYLDSVEINVFETRETVARRERQLRTRLKSLGITDP